MKALNAQQTELAAVCRQRLEAGGGLITMLDELCGITATQHDPPLTDDAVLKVISHVTRERGDSETVKVALQAATEQPIPLTDQGNAERLAVAHGDDLRYVPGLGWFLWDGRRFKRDTDGAVMRRMVLTVRGIYAEAASEPDADKRKAITKHATASEGEPRLRRAIALAQHLERFIVVADDLDADSFVLNALNGIICLKTGRLLPHDRAKLCTKIAGADYDPAALDLTWERVLADATGGDQELEGFIRRAAGATLVGEVAEQKLLFLHGPGATGKSTLLAALSEATGEYAVTADFETFIARRDTGGARSDLARLSGARMVVGVEVDDGRRLAESVLKQLTGGDKISARFLYGDYFEFTPRFTLWLAANRRPSVDANDDAMWRRIVQVPFTHVIPPEKRDPAVLRTLTRNPDARAAVLAWAVRGCIEWQDDGGLIVPASVRAYTEQYRQENDPLAGWLSDCAFTDPRGVETVSALRASYEAWTQQNAERPVSSRRFAASMRSHGFQDAKGAGGKRVWEGISLSGVSGATDAISAKSPQEQSLREVCGSHATHATGATHAVFGYDEEAV